ncbi:MAG: anti-sigma factor domain-containing protein [Micrococcaceae bacterium]
MTTHDHSDDQNERDQNERDRAAELLGAWAVDAVDPEERALVERVLARDPELRAEADELQRVTAKLAASLAVEPPESLREAVLARIATDQSGAADQASTPEQSSETGTVVPLRRRRPWIPAVAAAAAAAAVVVAVTWGISTLGSDGITDQDQHTAVEQVMEDPAAQHFTADLPEIGELEIALGADGTGVLAGRQVPDPGDAQAYQLWTIDGDAAPASHGLVEVHDGRVLMPLEGVPAGAIVAVTVEPAGGSEQPTTEPILAVETAVS